MHHKRCDRCKSEMRKAEVGVYGESLKPKVISAYHCMHCGRREYGSDVHASSTSIQAPG
jgi:hypothetical protein